MTPAGGDPPDPEIAQHGEQPQDGLAGQPRIGELEPDADGLPIQNRPTTSRTYLTATACLAGGLVSVGLAVTEIAEYVKHNRVDNLAILGMVIGGLAGFTAAVVNDEKPPGWAGRINTVAVWLAVTGFSSLLFFFGANMGGGRIADKFTTGPAKVSSQAMTATSPVPRGWITSVLSAVPGRGSRAWRLLTGLPGCGLVSRRDLRPTTARLGGVAVRSWRHASSACQAKAR